MKIKDKINSCVRLIELTRFILCLVLIAMTGFISEAHAQSLNQDTQALSELFSQQGYIHRHMQIGTVMTTSTSLSFSFVNLDACMLTTQVHWNSEETSSTQKDHDSNSYNYTYNLHNIVNISTEPTAPKDKPNLNYEQPVFVVNVQLSNIVTPQRVFHESTRNDNSLVDAYAGLSYYVKSDNDAQKLVNILHHLAQSCKTKSQQNTEDLPSEEQSHYKQILAHGKPAQMYATALDMVDDGHTELALQMFQAIIDKYPDDSYATKAIDKREALRNSMKHSQTNGSQNTIAHTDNNNGNIQQCQASCQSTKNSCDMTYSNNMGTQLGNTINGVRGHNSVAAQQSASQILGDPNACQNEYDSCTARCH
jgi:TolA-binding protein